MGLLYAGWALISHIGAKIREYDFYVNRHVDNKTNTYVDISGRRRDNDTNQLRTRVIENNGDIVLLDKKHRVVRNVSLEERMQKWEQKRNDPNRDHVMETALKTKELRTTHPINPETKITETLKGPVYLDYKTGEAYYCLSVTVPKKYTGAHGDIPKGFYVKVNDPYNLVRLCDSDRAYEKHCQEMGRYNWLDNPQDERAFINDYNSRPFRSYDISVKTKEWFMHLI